MSSISGIQQRLEESGLGRMAEVILREVRPSVRLVTGEASVQPVSRLGGRPNLPEEIRWPVRASGRPLSFIAQLDLAVLPTIDDFALPEAGSLFFYYDAEQAPWGFDPKDKDGTRVLYSPAPLAESKLRRRHPDLDEESRFKGFAVTGTLEMSLPGPQSGILRPFQPTQAEWEAYYDLVEPAGTPLHRVGGNANEIQGPMGLEAQLVSNGIYCGDREGFEEGRKRGLDAGAADWRLLLQVDSEERLGMMWGDAGRIYFLIRKDDLTGRRFDRVWLILQCG